MLGMKSRFGLAGGGIVTMRTASGDASFTVATSKAGLLSVEASR
jgi:hypothetical protein